MATNIKLKYSSVAGRTPTLSDLDLRELAVNTADGKLFLRKGNGSGTDSIVDITSESDPVFLASAAAGVTTTKISNWDTAYGWGDHASAGYQSASTALTTSTTFSGDVSGTYNAIVVANDSHTHDSRYYTETESDARFLGISAKAADSNLLDGIDSGSFLRSDANDSASGVLTFSGGLELTGGPGTIAGSTFANGWLRIGTSSLGYAFDNNEMVTFGACIVNSASGSTLTYINRPAFNGGTSGSLSPFTVDSTQVVTNLNADLIDGNHASAFALKSGTTFTGNVTIEDSELKVGDVSGDSYVLIKHVASDDYGFDWQHDNASVFINEEGSVNQALVLGDVDANNSYSGLFGISHTSNAGVSWTKKLDLRGDGDLYIGSSAQNRVLTTADEGSGNGLDADTLDGQQGSYYQPASTALTTSTTFGGDVSGTYNAIVIADDSHNHIIGNVDGLQSALDAKAPLASPALTGTPTAPTAAAGTNTTQIATTAFVSTAVSNLVDSAPGALDTLNELAAALGDDANFSTTVTNSIATKLSLSGGQMTGNITFSGAQTVDGRDLSVDGAKLDGIESGATADQTASEILTAIKTVDGSGSGLDADLLDGQQGSYYLNTSSGSQTKGNSTDSRANALTLNYSSTATFSANSDIGDGNRILTIQNPSTTTSNGLYAALHMQVGPSVTQRVMGDIKFVRDNGTRGKWYFTSLNTSGTFLDTLAFSTDEITYKGNTVWHAGNDGSGSGLDADTLDGQHGSYYQPASTALTTSTTFSGDVSGTYNAIVVANDSHTHDGRYYTETEADARFLGISAKAADSNLLDGIDSGSFLRSDTADTATGTITISGLDNSLIAQHNVSGNAWSGRIISKNSTTDCAAFIGSYNGFPGLYAHNNALNAWHDVFINSHSTGTGQANVYLGTSYINGNVAWHAGNDGSGSGLDADTLDGQQGSYYQPASTALTTSTTFGGDVSGTYNAIVVANDSHTHDGRYYTETESDARYLGISAKAADSNLLDGIDSGSFLRSDTADTMSADLTIADDKKLYVGGTGGLEIYHTASNNTTYINETGLGALNIGGDDSVNIANAALTEYKARFFTDGAVELYYDNVKKFETTSTGVSVTGGAYISGDVGIGTSTPGYKLEVNGSFAATTKSFVIPHPTKPDHKLRYGSLEGPENGVYVRGRSKNFIIELPDYWVELVDPDSITVNLTPIGKTQTLWVKDIKDNKIYLGSKCSEVNYFYMILAERADVEKLEVEFTA